jgi:hypothetical protein
MRVHLDVPEEVARHFKGLAETNFRVSQTLLADLLAEDFERKRHLDE